MRCATIGGAASSGCGATSAGYTKAMAACGVVGIGAKLKPNAVAAGGHGTIDMPPKFVDTLSEEVEKLSHKQTRV